MSLLFFCPFWLLKYKVTLDIPDTPVLRAAHPVGFRVGIRGLTNPHFHLSSPQAPPSLVSSLPGARPPPLQNWPALTLVPLLTMHVEEEKQEPTGHSKQPARKSTEWHG